MRSRYFWAAAVAAAISTTALADPDRVPAGGQSGGPQVPGAGAYDGDGDSFRSSGRDQFRASASEKGSVLIYPKVEVRWDAAGEVTQDTLIQLTNDYPSRSVHVNVYFVTEFCDRLYFDFDLTHNQPAYWSVAYGLGSIAVPPVTALSGVPYPDPEGSNEGIVRGFLVVIATDGTGCQINWNHLTGLASIVNYVDGRFTEYNPYAFGALNGDPGDRTSSSCGHIYLDGNTYESGFNRLLLEFIASGSTAFSGGGHVIMHDTDVSLVINDIDVRQDRDQYYTKARYLIWNEDETSFQMEYCITCYDERLLSDVGGLFLVQNLQTNMGYAQIEGLASELCDDPPDIISSDVALLGVATKVLSFDVGDVNVAASTLPGSGTQPATIWYDPGDEPEELYQPGDVGTASGTPSTPR